MFRVEPSAERCRRLLDVVEKAEHAFSEQCRGLGIVVREAPSLRSVKVLAVVEIRRVHDVSGSAETIGEREAPAG
jgi:hypothetical protein